MESLQQDACANFLTAVLHERLPKEYWAHIWRRSDKRTWWVRTLDGAMEAMRQAGTDDVYLGIGLKVGQGGQHERIQSSTCMGLFGVLADIDIAGPLHKGDSLPPDEDAAVALLGEFPPATVVVHSGHGLQAWWLFGEPWLFDEAGSRMGAIALLKSWQDALNKIAGTHNWQLDAIGDVSRVFRIPGTLNAKDPELKLPVRLIRSDGPFYTVDGIRETCVSIETMFADPNDEQTGDEDPIQSAHIDRRRRFTPQHPCPVCGGTMDEPVGKGTRCWGFISEDGLYVHCTRDEKAGSLAKGKDSAYAHERYGLCHCGIEHSPIPDSMKGVGAGNGGGGLVPAFIQESRVFDYERNDRGNAKRLVNQYGGNLRFVHEYKDGWYHWNGTVWVRDPFKVIEYEKDISTAMHRGALDIPDDQAWGPQRKLWLAWAVSSGQWSHLSGTRKAAESDTRINISVNQLDADPVLLGFPNGYLNLKTGDFTPPNPGKLVTKLCGADYNPVARSSIWDATLDLFLPDLDERRDFQTAIGACINGRGKEDMFVLNGRTRCGKSTVMGAINAAFGDYAGTIAINNLLQGHKPSQGQARPDLVHMLGKRLVQINEASEYQRLDSGQIKSLLGGTDKMSLRALFGEEFEALPTFGIWLLTNQLPKLDADDEAIWERLHVFEFKHQLPFEDRNQTERDKVKDMSITGQAILAWILEGWWRYTREYNGKLYLPTTVGATSTYRSEQDVIAQFITEHCSEGPGESCLASTFRESLRSWLSKEKIVGTFSDQRIGRVLTARGYTQDRHPKTRAKLWRGVSVQDSDDQYSLA